MRCIFFILVLTIFLSCEKELVYDLEGFDPYVVVNSIISTDSTYSVNLTYSKSIFDQGDFQPVEDAVIFIAVKDEDNIRRQEFTLNHQGNGLYTRDNNPSEGKTYEMLIEVNGEELRAQTYVPRVIEASVNVVSTVIDEDTEQQSTSVEITLNGIEEDDQNFYAWEIEEVISEAPSDDDVVHGQTMTSDMETGSASNGSADETDTSEDRNGDDNDLSLASEDETPPQTLDDPLLRTNGINITSPSDINNGSFTASFVTAGTSSNNDDSVSDSNGNTPSSSATNNNGNQRYKLRVWAISPDYYQYLKSLETTGLPTSENNIPGLYSNISNGSGIFAGYNIKEYYIDL